MTEFKLNDRVRVNEDTFNSTHIGYSTDPRRLNGKIGTVIQCKSNLGGVMVQFEEGVWPCAPWLPEDSLTHIPDIREDAYKYLTGSSSVHRQNALEDLAHVGFFHAASPEGATELLERYLSKNPRGFCEQGIGRFRTALKVPVPCPPLPERSPLHPEAINLADLKFGDLVRRYHNSQTLELYVFLGEQRESPSQEETQILVARVNCSGSFWNPGKTEWIYTADAGLTPYGGRSWNKANYCLREGITKGS